MKRILVFLILVFQLTFHSSELMAQSNPYESTLLTLCDALLATQINDPADPNFGALVCPSTNPEVHPIHSRAAEAVYPFAVAWKLTGKVKYRDAAIKLGNWLITVQETSGKKAGGWSEVWPDPEQKGWFGTTTDQLISMAGAYAILKPRLNASEIENWNSSMEKAAEFVMANFPVRTNINYNPTGAATLVMAFQVLDHPKQSWLIKADSLMNTYTLKSIDRQNLLTGEGMGVDGGYNIAQSIGFIALYAILKNDPRIRQIAADLLKEHYLFVYPNGSIDNSWGTRSYKWTYESGTKTAPGVYFSFALLADLDTTFNAAGLKCLEYLNKSMKDGWIAYGPHAKNHESCSPPCNYSTFARAQSIALSIEYRSMTTTKSSFPALESNWYRFFPTINVAVVKTDKIMATVSAYGQIGRYSRASVCRGGSISNLWYEGFGENGFLQSSSTASYQRIEAMHMPNEKDLLPLTPRIEFKVDSTSFSNIFEANATMKVEKELDNICVKTNGTMQTINGDKSDVNYSLTHRFYSSRVTKEITVQGRTHQEFSIIEPIVNDPGSTFYLKNDSTVIIKTKASKTHWELKVTNSTVPFKITLGTDSEKYWCPFPAIEAIPIIISFKTVSNSAQTIKICLGMTDDKTDTK